MNGDEWKGTRSTAAVSIDSSALPIYFKEFYHSSIISSILFRRRGPLGLSGPQAGSSCKAISFEPEISLRGCLATTQRLQALTHDLRRPSESIFFGYGVVTRKALLLSLCLFIMALSLEYKSSARIWSSGLTLRGAYSL